MSKKVYSIEGARILGINTANVNKVFLGGTCANTTWRDEIAPLLRVNYFNPVVDDWNEKAMLREREEKALCNVHLYVITSAMIGLYSIAEVIDSIHESGKYVLLHVLPAGFDDAQLKSLKAVAKMVQQHGQLAFIDDDLMLTVVMLNNQFGTRVQ